MAYGNASCGGETVRLLLWPLAPWDCDLSVVALRRFLPPPPVGDIRDENDGDEERGDASAVRPDAGKSARALPFDFIFRASTHDLSLAWLFCWGSRPKPIT